MLEGGAFRDLSDRMSQASQAGLWALCAELARAVVEADPEHWFAYYYLGEAFTKLQRYGEADAALAEALWHVGSETRSKANVLSLLGHLNRERGRSSEAEDCYRQSHALRADDAGPLIFLGDLYTRQGRLAEGMASFRDAAGCASGCIDEAYCNLGIVLLYQERYEEAIPALRTALQLDSSYRYAKLALRDIRQAMNLLHAEMPSDTTRHPKAAAQRAPRRTVRQESSARVWQRLMRAFHDEQWATALVVGRDYAMLEPRNHAGQLALGAVLTYLCRFEEAEDILKRNLESAKSEEAVPTLAQLGGLELARWRFAEAEGFFRLAADAQPRNPRRLVDIGRVLLQCGRISEADACFAEAMRGDECNAAKYYAGLIRLRQERYEEAIAMLEDVLSTDATFRAAKAPLKDARLARRHCEQR